MLEAATRTWKRPAVAGTGEEPSRKTPIRLAAIDLDGTTYLDGCLLPGSAAGIDLLQRHGVKCIFMTNNSVHQPYVYFERLCKLGIAVAPEDIFTPLSVAVELFSNQAESRIFFYGEDESRAFLETKIEFAKNPQNATAIIVGLNRAFILTDLQNLARGIESGVPYYATNTDRVWPQTNGGVPDTGVIIAAIAAFTDRHPLILGKPSLDILEIGLLRFGCTKHEAVIIGDSVYTDMALAKAAGVPAYRVCQNNAAIISNEWWTPVASILQAAEIIIR